MTFIVSRQQLSNELTLLSTVREKKDTLPALSHVLMETSNNALLKLTVTNLNETLISNKVSVLSGSDPQTCCIPLRQLSQLIKLLDNDEVKLTVLSNGRLEVKSNRSKHILPTLKVEEFPETDSAKVGTLPIAASLLEPMLSHVLFARLVPSGDLRLTEQKFTGIHLTLKDNELTIAGTDRLRLAIARCKVSGPDFSVVIDVQGAEVVQGFEGEVKIGASESFFVAESEGRRLISRTFNDKPFDWRAMFPVEYQHQIELPTEPLLKALRRTLLTGKESARFVIDGLKWTLSGDTLAIESKGGDAGKSEEEISITCPSLNGSSLVLGVNGASLLEYLSLAEKTFCQFSEGKSVIRFTPAVAKEFEYEFLANTVNLKF